MSRRAASKTAHDDAEMLEYTCIYLLKEGGYKVDIVLFILSISHPFSDLDFLSSCTWVFMKFGGVFLIWGTVYWILWVVVRNWEFSILLKSVIFSFSSFTLLAG